MENQLNFEPRDEHNVHHVKGKRHKNSVVFACEQCDYVRTFYDSGKIKVEGNSEIMHEGVYQPVGIDFSSFNMN
jgi:hypothetical protein